MMPKYQFFTKYNLFSKGKNYANPARNVTAQVVFD